MFCSPQNISQLIQYLLLEDAILREAASKQLAGELVRCMIGLATDFSSSSASSLELDKSPYSALLTQVLALVASDRLSQESVVKLVHRCNHSLFSFAEADVRASWLQKICEMLPAATQTMTKYKFGTF